MAEEIERACVELGEEGRLIRMQLEELRRRRARREGGARLRLPRRGRRRAHRRGARRARRAAVQPAARVRAPGGARVPARPPIRSTTRSRRAATACSRTSRGCPTASSSGWSRASRASKGSSARLSASSRRSRVSAPSGPARSERASGGCRSTIWSTATSSCSPEQGFSAKKWPFSSDFRYTGASSAGGWRPAGVIAETPTQRGGSGCTESATRWCIRTTVRGRSSRRRRARCSGEKREYLTIKILHNDMTVNVPATTPTVSGCAR